MRTNIKTPTVKVKTHEGGMGMVLRTREQLLRTMATCLLFENTFYESGNDIAMEIRKLAHKCDPKDVAEIAIYVKNVMKLRHSPMYLALQLLDHPVKNTYGFLAITETIKRADELAEILAMYWKGGRKPLANQLKKGIANAFRKFDEYQLAKWNRKNRDVKVVDALFMCHPTPKDKEQETLWKKLVENTLETPWTWEVELSAGKDKKGVWESLIANKKLPYFALIKNLRNMDEVGVERERVVDAIVNGIGKSKMLPFQFITAAKYAPMFVPALDKALVKSLEGLRLPGKTMVLVDVSGSMDYSLSDGETTRLEPACALAALLREVCEDCRVLSFSLGLKEVPAYRGLALVEAIKDSQGHGGTYLAGALEKIASLRGIEKYNRIVVITDEQSADTPENPPTERGYVINVAPYTPALKLNGKWARIDGWSERVIDWICFEEYGKMLAEWED